MYEDFVRELSFRKCYTILCVNLDLIQQQISLGKPLHRLIPL